MPSAVNRIAAAAAAMFLCGTTPAAADSLKERLEKMPAPAYSSSKSMAALEYCIAVGVSKWMAPLVVHGERKTLVAGNPAAPYTNAVMMLVLIEDQGDRRALAMHAPKGWDERTDALIRSCT